MNVNIENPSALRRKLTIELEPAEIKTELDRAYNDLRRNVVLKGFRPGHAPRTMLERLFGDQVRGEIVQKLIKESTDKALEEQNLTPLLPPEIVTEESDLAKTLRFSAIFDLRPEIVVPDYQGLHVPRPQVEVTDEEVRRRSRTCARLGPLKKVEDRTGVERGDLVMAEIEGFDDGQPIQGARSKQRILEVSSERLAHGLDEVLTGAEVGHPVQERAATRPTMTRKTSPARPSNGARWSRKSTPRCCRRSTTNSPRTWATSRRSTNCAIKCASNWLQRAHEQADMRARQGLLDLVIERNPIEVPQSLTLASAS